MPAEPQQACTKPRARPLDVLTAYDQSFYGEGRVENRASSCARRGAAQGCGLTITQCTEGLSC
jgi:hypothetical protein